MYGIDDSRFVITVAPQNKIYPHGRTYPMSAVARARNRVTTFTDHVSGCAPFRNNSFFAESTRLSSAGVGALK
jgi:hypothetical protein